MSEDQQFYSRNIDATHVIGGLESNLIRQRPKNFDCIIPKSKIIVKKDKKIIIGGDPGTSEESPPAIIIEKKNELISKISVQCPCGRHSELTCEYDE